MKDFFDRENFLFSTFDKEQRRQSLVVAILICISFAVTSFVFFNALYAFANIIGAIVSGSVDVALYDLTHSLPMFFSLFMSIWTLLLLQASFRNGEEHKRDRSLFKNAIVIISFGVVNLIYVIVMLAIGRYVSIVEGSYSPMYPLNTVLNSLFFIALGACVIVYLKFLKEKKPYVVPHRAPVESKLRGLYCTFVAFWMLFAFFGFSGFWLSLFIYDFMHEYAFYGIALLLVYLLPAVQIAFWEFYYNELKEEKRKDILLPLAIISLCVSIVVAALYFIALSTNLDAPSNAGFGMLPVAFAASVNIATLLVVATPIIVSVTALIKGLLLRRK